MTVTLNIIPREPFRAYLQRVERWACLVVHRRGGKTVSCIQDLINRANTHKRPGPPLRYGYIAPTRDQAKDIAWPYLKRYLNGIPGIKINESELRISLEGKWEIRLYSGDNYERMRGLYFDGVILDECADIDPLAWPTVIRPCLTDYKGWATFIGTPKGKNDFFRIHENARKSDDWYSLLLPASVSGILDPDEVADLKRDTPEAIYLQEYECDFAVALQGAIYAAHIARIRAAGRIQKVTWDPGLPCWTFWDLGSPRNTAVWTLQFARSEIRLLHCDTGKDWLTGDRVAAMTGRGYAYAGHILPHDASALQKGGISYEDELKRAGLQNIRTLSVTKDKNARIHRLISLIPSMVIDETGCEQGIAALEHYHTEFDSKKRMYKDTPHHDWSSHPCDALGYLAEAIDGGVVKYGYSINDEPARVISPIEGLGDVGPSRRVGRVISPMDF